MKNLANGVSFMWALFHMVFVGWQARCAAFLAFSSASCCCAWTSPACTCAGRRGARRASGRRELLPEVGLGDGVLDVLAHVVERLDLGVDRETVELLLDAHPRLRGLHLGQHVSLSALSFLISVWTPRSEVLAESASLLRRLEIALQLGDVGRERVLLLDEHDGQVVLVGLDRDVQLRLRLRQLFAGPSSGARPTSSRRRMMAAVAVLSFEYFSIIELIAFS